MANTGSTAFATELQKVAAELMKAVGDEFTGWTAWTRLAASGMHVQVEDQPKAVAGRYRALGRCRADSLESRASKH